MRAALLSSWMLPALILSGCATQTPEQATPQQFFADHLFSPTAAHVKREDIFTLSSAMKLFVDNEIEPVSRKHGNAEALVRALYTSGLLKLEYESSTTRDAAQAFEARAGNCLSLVVMTTAFARHLGVPIQLRLKKFGRNRGAC